MVATLFQSSNSLTFPWLLVIFPTQILNIKIHKKFFFINLESLYVLSCHSKFTNNKKTLHKSQTKKKAFPLTLQTLFFGENWDKKIIMNKHNRIKYLHTLYIFSILFAETHIFLFGLINQHNDGSYWSWVDHRSKVILFE